MGPAAPDARFEAARTRLRDGRAAEALGLLDDFLNDQPGYLPALATRGSALLALGRQDEAEAAWRDALASHPTQEVLVWNLGALLMERGRPAEALALAERVLAAAPAHGRALILRGDALTAQGRYEEAVETYRRAPATDDLLVDSLTKHGMALAALGRSEEALELLDRAVAHNPQDLFAPFRRGCIRLSRRDFGGWADYEARWRMPNMVDIAGHIVTRGIIPQLALAPTREGLAGQRVLLLGEQGIGDQIMFASMIPDLAEVAASVTCVCNPRLVRLFSGSPLCGAVFLDPANARIAASGIDRIVAMGSLGHAFRPDEAAFPGTPYLTPRPEVRAKWAERLGPRSRPLRIGLTWRGGMPSTRQTQRSLTLEGLRPLLSLPGCEFVSLQHGDVAAELAASPVPIRSFPPEQLSDFEDLGGLVAELDLVVSVQTSIVHLCGAIGQTCLTLVPGNAEWRYGATGGSMPWYRSVRIYRQAELGVWEPVIEQVVSALRERLAAS